MTGAFESTAPLGEHAVQLGLPGVLRRDRALAQLRDVPGLELALAAAAARRHLVGVDVVLLGDQQRLPAPLRVVEDEVVVGRGVAAGVAGRRRAAAARAGWP